MRENYRSEEQVSVMKRNGADRLRKPDAVRCRTLILVVAFACILPGLFAQIKPAAAEDPVFLMDVPLYYGEESFIRRIEHPSSGRKKPLGLLLSGGSARAFAHIGALKRLDEEGLSPDFIVTDSMGSIVGLLYGAGLSPDTILQLVKDTELSQLFEPELPLAGGILDPSTFIELMQSVLGINDISELPIPVTVVCEDLKSKRTAVLAEGDFRKVLGASFALPVYFKPVDLFGLRLIDGGISNLVPAAIPYRYTDDVIVSTTFYQKELNLNNPLTILNVSMDISKSRAGVSAIKQYDPGLIRCDVESFSFMDFGKLDELVGRGYESAERALLSDGKFSRFQKVPDAYLSDLRAEMDAKVRAGIRRYRRSGTVRYSEPGIGVKIKCRFRRRP